MDAISFEHRGYRVGGLAAVVGGAIQLSIVAAFALTGLGAAGDRSYGSFSGLTFLPSGALMVAAAGMYQVFAHRVGPAGRRGLVAAGLGLTLIMLGQLGGEWLSFPRSGNFLIAPGSLLVMGGLVAFSMSARRAGVARSYSTLTLLIGVLPLVYLPVAMVIELVRGSGFPPSLHDNYFRVQNVLASLLWLGVGITLLRDPAGAPPSAGSANQP